MAKNAEQFFDGKRFSRYDGNNYFWWKVPSNVHPRFKAHQSVSMHRYTWWFHNGEIPEGFHIHHIDGNPENNAIENLEMIDRIVHSRSHAVDRMVNDPEKFNKFQVAGVKAAPAWHASEEGLKWHSEMAIKTAQRVSTHGVTLQCTYCGKDYQGIKNKIQAGYCSPNCQTKARRKSGVDDEQRVCVVCSTPFVTNKYTHKKTCSGSCAYRTRSIKRA